MELKKNFLEPLQPLEWAFRLWQQPPFAGKPLRLQLAEPHEGYTLELPPGLERTAFLLLLHALPVEQLAMAAEGQLATAFVQSGLCCFDGEDYELFRTARRPVDASVLPGWPAAPLHCRFGGNLTLQPAQVTGWLAAQPAFAGCTLQARYKGKQGMEPYAGPQADAKLMLLTGVDEHRTVMLAYHRALNALVVYGPQGTPCPDAL